MASAIAAQVTWSGQSSGTVSLHDEGHHQKSQGGQSGAKPEDEQDRQQDFRRAGGERHHRGHRKA